MSGCFLHFGTGYFCTVVVLTDGVEESNSSQTSYSMNTVVAAFLAVVCKML